MQAHEPIHISDRDRVLRAWQNTMELIRDYQLYAREIQDETLSELFSRLAEEECRHGADLHDVLKKMAIEKLNT
ncbi:MAG: rubrerythrin [Clostridia bacterium]|nr:rubrerythrin [Clostridia bacterium]